VKRTEPCNLCPPEAWVEKPAADRPGYLITHCAQCGRCLGHRPAVTKRKGAAAAEPQPITANQYYLEGM
jgi:hypothetical protein